MTEIEQPPQRSKKYKDMTPEERKQYRDEMKAFRKREQEKWDAQRVKSIAEQKQRADEARIAEAAAREEALKPKVLRIINRGLLDVLVWLPHRRARNWVARVEIEPTIAGGIKRKFFPRAAGKTGIKAVVPEDLEVGEVLEFGADYVSFGGNRSPTRMYAVVMALSATEMRVKPYEQLVDAQQHGTR